MYSNIVQLIVNNTEKMVLTSQLSGQTYRCCTNLNKIGPATYAIALDSPFTRQGQQHK